MVNMISYLSDINQGVYTNKLKKYLGLFFIEF